LPRKEWKELNKWITQTESNSTSSFSASIKIGESILEVLNFLHARNLLHLDIKSENIKVQGSFDNPTIKLLDFGVTQHNGGHGAAVTGVGGDIRGFLPKTAKFPTAPFKALVSVNSGNIIDFRIHSNIFTRVQQS
jgi:serine/threonine protein kinase